MESGKIIERSQNLADTAVKLRGQQIATGLLDHIGEASLDWAAQQRLSRRQRWDLFERSSMKGSVQAEAGGSQRGQKMGE